MGLLDRLFGRRPRSDEYYVPPRHEAPPQHGQYPAAHTSQPRSADEQAVERYRYLLRTAPPDQIEEAHAEAFAKLTPDQRQQVLVQLAAAVPAGERPQSDDPRSLARAATRAEIRQPGILERAFGGGYGPGYGRGPGSSPGYGPGYGSGYGPGYGGPSFGSMMGASLLGTVGGLVVGTAVADALFDTGLGDGGLFGGGDEEASAEGYADGQDGGGGDYAADGGYGGDPGADFAGGAQDSWDGGGDFGGDFGGGEF